jgi:hypothetical protein
MPCDSAHAGLSGALRPPAQCHYGRIVAAGCGCTAGLVGQGGEIVSQFTGLVQALAEFLIVVLRPETIGAQQQGVAG